MAVGARPLAFQAATHAAPQTLAVRRAALWALLASKAIGGWGVQWDIQWHVLIGRDSFWIPPHVMTYAGVSLVVLLSFGVLAWETLRERGRAGRAEPGTVRVCGLSGTRGFHLAAWGIALTVLAAPIDDLWHRLYGLDVTLWSPPHLLGIFGSVINSLACVVIAREAYRDGSPVQLVAVIVSGGLLYGNLHLAVQPSNLVAYVHGGVLFYTHAVLSALLLPSTLVVTARLSGNRWAPVLLLLVIIVVGIAGQRIAQLGFELLQPVSIIQDEVAKDPTSPVALAYTIARKTGGTPGRTGGMLHSMSLLPALAMALLDARRRPVAATVAYAVALFAAVGWLLGRSPAFGPLLPDAATTAVALALTVAAALLGGLAARWLADALDPAAARRRG
jgi:hypothetical protein